MKWHRVKFVALTVEKALIEAKKLARDIANGVRCVIKRRGITGYGAQ